MDHVLKALDEHIAHQDWLLKCARQEVEDLRAELLLLRKSASQAEAPFGEASATAWEHGVQPQHER